MLALLFRGNLRGKIITTSANGNLRFNRNTNSIATL